MRRLFLVLALAIGLGACGATDDTRDPGAIHDAWISALRTNDRRAAQALLDPDAELSVDRALEQARYLVTHDAQGAGRFVAVDLEPPVAQGAGQSARSIWRLERLNSCFVATLVETAQGWRVTNWEERLSNCPIAAGGA